MDDFNREVLHIEVDTSINSQHLVRVFEQIKRDHGLPQVVRSDNGPNFWARRSPAGSRPMASHCSTSNRESRTRTPSSSASIVPSARKCSTGTCSPVSTTFAKPPTGG
ncbi:hypothetical protein [Xanthomonas sp. LMG 8992]|uniref:hypothetical protein n=1 Tax=Xanthomonas sp. LMG 8992 TaxID=1591157 RepID=UPI0034E0CEB1